MPWNRVAHRHPLRLLTLTPSLHPPHPSVPLPPSPTSVQLRLPAMSAAGGPDAEYVQHGCVSAVAIDAPSAPMRAAPSPG